MGAKACLFLWSVLTLASLPASEPIQLDSVSAKPLEVFDSLSSTPVPSTPWTDTQEIYALLLKMVDRWNAHDIDGYIEAFWKSPDLWCVVGAETYSGFAELYRAYQRGYTNREDMGALSPERVQIRKLTGDIAIALAQWTARLHDQSTHLTATINVRKFQEGWKIVAFHTTFLEQ